MIIAGDIGVIADTHGLVRAEVANAFEGCELIIHLGDIGSLDVITELRKMAPVVAVRGNVDKGLWVNEFPEFEAMEINGKFIYLVHNIADLDFEPKGNFDAVLFGHSHVPCNERRDGVLYFNPASAGPRRFSLPISVGRLRITEIGIEAEINQLIPDSV